MAEYKDIAPLKKQIADIKKAMHSPNSDYLTGYLCALSVTEGVIAGLPAADVVEVVRCKDCPHLIKEIVEEETPYGFTDEHDVFGCGRILELTGKWVDVFLDDFCSNGERKEK